MKLTLKLILKLMLKDLDVDVGLVQTKERRGEGGNWIHCEL